MPIRPHSQWLSLDLPEGQRFAKCGDSCAMAPAGLKRKATAAPSATPPTPHSPQRSASAEDDGQGEGTGCVRPQGGQKRGSERKWNAAAGVHQLHCVRGLFRGGLPREPRYTD